MNFSRDTFATNLGKYTGTNFVGNSSDWDQWSDTKGDLNTYLLYGNSSFQYRTWSPETSTMPTDLGMVVSCKIDFVNGVSDDHMILIVGFLKVAGATAPTINFIQASVQFNGDDDKNFMIDPIKSDPNNPTQNLGEVLYNSLNSQILADNFGTDYASEGRKTFPDIAQDNLNAMIGDKDNPGAVSA